MMLRRKALSIAFLLAAFVPQGCPAQDPSSDGTVSLQATQLPIPASLFGILPIGLWWGASWPPFTFYGAVTAATWNMIEPQRGAVNFKRVDDVVNEAAQHNEHVILILGDVPSWAFCNPSSAKTGGPSQPACNVAAWTTYVRYVVSRYSKNPTVEGYELWNEPNNATFFHGSTSSLVQMNCAAFKAIKQIQPSALVLTAGINAQESSWTYLQNYASAGGLNCADVLAEHFYVAPKPPEAMLRKIAIVRKIAQTYRPGMPIWNTETGWRIINHDRNLASYQADWAGRFLTDDESVAYVGRAYLLTWAAGVSRLYWYAWGHASMGLNEFDLKTPKRAAYAYTQMQSWLVGYQLSSCKRSTAGVWQCNLQKQGDQALIAWSESNKTTLSVPSNFHAAQELTGAQQSIRGNSFQLGIIPVRFTER